MKLLSKIYYQLCKPRKHINIVTLVPGVQMFRMIRPCVLMWLVGHTFVGSLGAGRKLYQGNENTINNYFNVS